MTISITRVYTRLGDHGETGLVGGQRVPKDSPRIVAYGTIDELNAIVGIVRTFNAERLAEGEHHRWLDEVLRRIQNELFDLGSELATPPEAEYEGMFKVGEALGVEDPRQADRRVQLVDGPVGDDPRRVLGDALAADQGGLALVAGSRVHARDADGHRDLLDH